MGPLVGVMGPLDANVATLLVAVLLRSCNLILGKSRLPMAHIVLGRTKRWGPNTLTLS